MDRESATGAAPVTSSERIGEMDVLRGFALLGVLIAHHAVRARDWIGFIVASLALILPPAMLYLGRWDIHPAPIVLLALLLVLARHPMAISRNLG